ncbi:MAG: hypothetical protein AAFN94_00515 [Pseudomonadota bacterium]
MTTAAPLLAVHALPGPHGFDLARALAQIAADPDTGNGADPLSLPEIEAHLAADPAHRICILYVDPVRVLCAAMTADQDPATVLEAWTDAARDALHLHRRNRRRSMIFEAGHLQRYAAIGLDRLQITADSQSLSAVTDATPAPAPLHALLARALLAETPQARAAAEELEASAQLLSNDDPTGSATMALAAYQDLQAQGDAASQARAAQDQAQKAHKADTARLEQARAALAAELAALQAELADSQSLIKDKTHQLETVQAKLEAATAAADALRKDRAADQAQLATLTAKVDSLTRQAARDSAAQQEMMQEMTAQRQAHSAALAASDTKLKETAATLEARDSALAEARSYIDHIMNSRSMRLTRPLRAMFHVLRGGR